MQVFRRSAISNNYERPTLILRLTTSLATIRHCHITRVGMQEQVKPSCGVNPRSPNCQTPIIDENQRKSSSCAQSILVKILVLGQSPPRFLSHTLSSTVEFLHSFQVVAARHLGKIGPHGLRHVGALPIPYPQQRHLAGHSRAPHVLLDLGFQFPRTP